MKEVALSILVVILFIGVCLQIIESDDDQHYPPFQP